MSDQDTMQENWYAVDSVLKSRMSKHAEILESVDEALQKYGASFEIASKVTPRIEPLRHEDEYEYRLKTLENKVEWLYEKKIDEESENILESIRNEFWKIPFVKAAYISRIPSGFDLLIVHNSDKTREALSAIVKAKINLRKQFEGNVFLELSVLRSSDFLEDEWKGKQLLFER